MSNIHYCYWWKFEDDYEQFSDEITFNTIDEMLASIRELIKEAMNNDKDIEKLHIEVGIYHDDMQCYDSDMDHCRKFSYKFIIINENGNCKTGPSLRCLSQNEIKI